MTTPPPHNGMRLLEAQERVFCYHYPPEVRAVLEHWNIDRTDIFQQVCMLADMVGRLQADKDDLLEHVVLLELLEAAHEEE